MQRPANIMNFDFNQMKRKIKERLAAAEFTDRLISRADLCNKLGVDRSTTYRWESANFLPKPVLKRGKTIRWSENEIDVWLATTKKNDL
ncbi:MAG: helix-turn-helix domain-containing protein [Candidatus Thiothrix putei]|jgi:Predicted transcriptional regulator|uniref:Transcriptional regulator, AlpA family n=2 Tax=Thiothrix TaxID=1030 RepID=A0A1H4GLU8_9GAMM|nr:AlpA family phage regulatory protein [Thiothrix caldifontis]WGZ92980.1 MAG: helix-turn-helix domain-containing protein [Candidatus Thiothrix putei]SEB10544.1 transcriptional regulator, AlpA family [Thiothrix caldifontis]